MDFFDDMVPGILWLTCVPLWTFLIYVQIKLYKYYRYSYIINISNGTHIKHNIPGTIIVYYQISPGIL